MKNQKILLGVFLLGFMQPNQFINSGDVKEMKYFPELVNHPEGPWRYVPSSEKALVQIGETALVPQGNQGVLSGMKEYFANKLGSVTNKLPEWAKSPIKKTLPTESPIALEAPTYKEAGFELVGEPTFLKDMTPKGFNKAADYFKKFFGDALVPIGETGFELVGGAPTFLKDMTPKGFNKAADYFKRFFEKKAYGTNLAGDALVPVPEVGVGAAGLLGAAEAGAGLLGAAEAGAGLAGGIGIPVAAAWDVAKRHADNPEEVQRLLKLMVEDDFMRDALQKAFDKKPEVVSEMVKEAVIGNVPNSVAILEAVKNSPKMQEMLQNAIGLNEGNIASSAENIQNIVGPLLPEATDNSGILNWISNNPKLAVAAVLTPALAYGAIRYLKGLAQEELEQDKKALGILKEQEMLTDEFLEQLSNLPEYKEKPLIV
ncbi:hypothetical protein HYV11_02295 [Candidatus Dependentiae bacterium]|nr:hypothetical protein [Candidatus Dependentiae bacterium]